MSEVNEKKIERYVVLRDTQSGQVSWVKLRFAEIEAIEKSCPRIYDILMVTEDSTQAGKCWAEHNS